MNSKWKQKVAESFDGCVDVYEEYSTIQRTVADALAAELPNYQAPSVLEIGCGTGFLTQHLLKRYPDGHFHITDIAPRMLAVARANIATDNRDIEWFVMDGEAPQSGHRYDLIVSSMTFQWFEDLPRSLERLQGLLNPGGCILYAMPGPETFKEWRRALEVHRLSPGVLDFEKPGSVFHEEHHVIPYQSAQNFLKHIRKTGACVPRQGYEGLSGAELARACQALDEQSQGRITWHILYGRLNASV